MKLPKRWSGRGAFTIKPPRPKALTPWLLRKVLQSLTQQFPQRENFERACMFLIPKGNPGAGMIRGRTNIAKTLTYRATYVPGGFNVERDHRRQRRLDGYTY